MNLNWVLDIFKKGYKKELEVDDLYEALDEHRSEYLGDQLTRLWDQELKHASARAKQPSLIWVLIRCHGRYAMFLELLLAFIELCIVMPQPIFLGQLIRYFTPNSNITYETAFLYAGCIIVTTALNVFISHAHAMAVFHIGMKIRVGLCSMIYRKALKLSKSALGETTVGHAVNLMSNDVSRFDVMLLFLAYIWIGPLETLIVGYLVWQQIGVSAIIGIAAVLVIIPLQGILGKIISSLRLRIAKRTDHRIKLMNEIIVGIQVIKMYAWEKPFAHLVSLARKREIQAVRTSAYTQGFLMCFSRLMGKNIAIFISIVAYVLLGNDITAEKMFVVTAYFNTLSVSMAIFLSLGIRFFAEGLASIERIRTFLILDEMKMIPSLEQGCKDTHVNTGKSSKPITDMKTSAPLSSIQGKGDHIDHLKNENTMEGFGSIKITNVTAKWSEDVSENTLHNISVNVRAGTLVAVIGPVGSGKTSLLHAILKELPLTCGSISAGGSVSYASQEPWLFTGPIRQNILFGQPLDKGRYRQVIRACALERDFQLLPNGDKTIVGERGVTLSGGQKARINLARAVYKEADIYLLDDPLSAVDTHVGRHLFDDCICDFLKNKTRVLITHQLQYLQTADNIIILNNGGIEATGTYTELHASGLDFAKQFTVEEEEFEANFTSSQASLYRRERQNSETSVLSSEFEPETMAEMRSHGGVSFRVYQSYCAAAGNCCITTLAFGVFLLSQIAFSAESYWMAYWSRVEEMNISGSIDNGTIANNSSALEWNPTRETCIYVFTALLIAVVVFDFGSAMLFYTLCMRASVRLHNAMFTSITRATMWFFNNHPSGQILNRFSKDMGSIDEFLPHILIDCIQIGLALIGVVTVVAIVNFWLLLPSVVMFGVFYVLRTYYVSTSRNVKRLEGITRSPVFSHLSATLQGLTTIRAFRAEALLSKEFDNHQDLHSSAWFMFIASSRAFALWLDSSCTIYIALVTLSFLFADKEHYGGDVGLAITQAIGLIGMIQWGIRQSAELENSMTSLERVLEYTTVESEPPLNSLPDKKPSENWPTQGAVMFKKAVLAYSKDGPPVLKKITFAVNPTEKVGIVGRTGAGKSSLISALFRLVDLSEGSIQIDGVTTASIGLHDLRSKISIIPQEPALFSGTLRENLDPFNEYSDSALWAALSEVEMKQLVDEQSAGLSQKVLEGGSNFSVGQRQLLCLARAIVRNNKILVLDEATANVDPQTDELIQATIRRKFVNCTVLTIAHRLHTVMDSDRILVMEAGSVAEYDHPHILLQNKKGILYQMVQQTGQAMAESLIKVAQTCFEKKSEECAEVEL
ncbi:probable multidrug resistance-associated protein lethal(2)03659 isoform X2 [Periplaneta americana]|uniref:probable multidrug resistance-associated protein lethal(2)03659 isoform X2 n=1 Tax=Periplaneta americana TaxID=6978 RepID=UPI0037E9017B